MIALGKRLRSTIEFFRSYPVRVKPYLSPGVLANPPETFSGPPNTLYSGIRHLLARLGLRKWLRNLIGLRLVLTARHFFSYSPNAPTFAHSLFTVRPYPLAHQEAAESGVNVVGYLSSSSGLGQSARSLIACIQTAGFDVSGWSIDQLSDESITGDGLPPDFITPQPPISIFNINADQTYNAEYLLGRDFYRGHYNIGYWYWELSSFPTAWEGAFALYDEIWTPTRFIQEAIAAHTDKPVHRTPIPMAIEQPSSTVSSPLALPEDRFVVLFVFDVRSIVERKNPFAVISAFERAFSEQERRERVTLVIKVNHLDEAPVSAGRLRQEVERLNGILLADRLDRAVIDSLFARCNTYISLHRSEGLGLTMAEAMALGKPVIGTAYSGNMDFMTEANSYLIPYQLVDIPPANGFYDSQGVWAEPDIEAAAAALREIYTQPAAAAAKGAQAAHDIRASYTVEAVAGLYRERLAAILKSLSNGG